LRCTGVTRPGVRLLRAADDQRLLRAEQRDLTQRLPPLARARPRAPAPAALAATPPDGREAQVLRETVLATLAGEPLRGVRVSVRPGRGEVAAAVSLACEGGLDPVLRTVTRLTRPGTGLVLASARLSAAASGVALDVEAQGMRPRS
jgi:hypothetical protein